MSDPKVMAAYRAWRKASEKEPPRNESVSQMQCRWRKIATLKEYYDAELLIWKAKEKAAEDPAQATP